MATRSETSPLGSTDAKGDTAKAPSGHEEASAAEETEDWWDHCPLCGTRLRNQGCKYRCPNCRYFMSCSDFD